VIQQEENHEKLIQNSLKKYSDIESRVRESVDLKIKENSEKAKNIRKNGLEKKKILEDQKEQERNEKFFNKILKIQKNRENLKSKSNELVKSRMTKSTSQQLKVQSRLIEDLPKLNLKAEIKSPKLLEFKNLDENHYKKIEKNELNRLMINTRITRNKLKFVSSK
jgi:hypothetical protein